MRFWTVLSAAFSGLMLLSVGCGNGAGAPDISGITLEPSPPVPAGSEVNVTAQVSGAGLTYTWRVTGGTLRNAAMRSAQGRLPRIAVTQDDIDDFGKVLTVIDLPFREKSLDLIRDGKALEDFDAVFLNSSEDISLTGKEQALKSWVSDGGALYASGRAADVIGALWPDKITFARPVAYIGMANGKGQYVAAKVIDNSSATSLGRKNVALRYPEDGWVPILSTGLGTRTLLIADASELVPSDAISNLPPGQDFRNMAVAVVFRHGNGVVLYTNFHYWSGQTKDERAVLHLFAAIICSDRERRKNHGLADLGGYVVKGDYVGFVHENEPVWFPIDIPSAEQVFFAFGAPDGVYEVKVEGPGDLEAQVSGPPPLTITFATASAGKWRVSAECVDDNNIESIPAVVTLGTRLAGIELVTTEPRAVWRAPSQPGLYTLTLKVLDEQGRTDQESVLVEVR